MISLPHINSSPHNTTRQSPPTPPKRHLLLGGSVASHHLHRDPPPSTLQPHSLHSVKLNCHVFSYSDDDDDDDDHDGPSLQLWNSIQDVNDRCVTDPLTDPLTDPTRNPKRSSSTSTLLTLSNVPSTTFGPRPWSKGRDILRDGLVTHPIQFRRNSSTTDLASDQQQQQSSSTSSTSNTIDPPTPSVWRPSGRPSRHNNHHLGTHATTAKTLCASHHSDERKRRKNITQKKEHRKSLYQKAMLRAQHDIGIVEKERIQRKQSLAGGHKKITPCSIQTMDIPLTLNQLHPLHNTLHTTNANKSNDRVPSPSSLNLLHKSEKAPHPERRVAQHRPVSSSTTPATAVVDDDAARVAAGYTSNPQRSIQVRVVSAVRESCSCCSCC